MGCDIHSIVEVKENGVWKVNTKKVFPNPWYRVDEKVKPKEEQWEGALEEMNPYPSDGRNYDWFSILADVRNGRGFAGVTTGEGFAVIAEPRGVPEDATNEWKEKVEQWDCDMHSHTYLYVEDFDNFDWNQITMKTGVVTLEQYKKLKSSNEIPESWCGMVSGDGIIVISEQKADEIIDGKNPFLGKRKSFFDDTIETKLANEWTSIYVSYNWPVIYSEWFKGNIENTIDPLRSLSKEYENVRMVFGFDN